MLMSSISVGLCAVLLYEGSIRWPAWRGDQQPVHCQSSDDTGCWQQYGCGATCACMHACGVGVVLLGEPPIHSQPGPLVTTHTQHTWSVDVWY